MKLNLMWQDIYNNEYKLGQLSREGEKYRFEIDEDGLKEAIGARVFWNR